MFPIPDERLAQHLGLTELCVGASRTDAADPSVLAWWLVSVEPSFSRSWTVGVIHEETWTDGPYPDSVTARGFVADLDGAAVAPLSSDPILECLGRLDPFRIEPTHRVKVANADWWVEAHTLDGLGYSLRWETQAVHGARFRFSNPRAERLMEFERVLFRFAREIVAASGVGGFEEQLRCWVGYRDVLAKD
jgi:hypothetical protein